MGDAHSQRSRWRRSAQAGRDTCNATPAAWPWIVHAAEGQDAEATAEFERLEALGCVRANVLLIPELSRVIKPSARVWQPPAVRWSVCPSSNMRLFGKTAQVTDLVSRHRVALGTDSRLSGSRDLLDELRLAATLGGLYEDTLDGLVTHVSAAILCLPDRGALRPGLRADLVVLPAKTRLRDATRSNVRLVMIEGIARYGDAEYVVRASAGAEWTLMCQSTAHPRCWMETFSTGSHAPRRVSQDWKWRA